MENFNSNFKLEKLKLIGVEKKNIRELKLNKMHTTKHSEAKISSLNPNNKIPNSFQNSNKDLNNIPVYKPAAKQIVFI